MMFIKVMWCWYSVNKSSGKKNKKYLIYILLIFNPIFRGVRLEGFLRTFDMSLTKKF